MVTSKSEVYNDNITIICPHCNFCEGQGIDDPRWHFDILKWQEFTRNNGDGNDLSRHTCGECGKDFIVEWDYDNVVND